MTDSVNDSGFIEWLRGLFEDADAASMFRWVIVAWLVLVAVMVVLDRLGTGLLGRSRPLEQVPPERARTWRWGRRTPPPTYSLLPTGTIAEHAHAAPIVESIPLSTRPLALPAAAPTSHVLANVDYWRWAGDPAAPLFGYENNDRLSRGQAPERYNPVTGRVESLDRDEASGTLLWPGDAESPLALRHAGETESGDSEDPDAAADTKDQAEAPTMDLEPPEAETEDEAEPDEAEADETVVDEVDEMDASDDDAGETSDDIDDDAEELVDETGTAAEEATDDVDVDENDAPELVDEADEAEADDPDDDKGSDEHADDDATMERTEVEAGAE